MRGETLDHHGANFNVTDYTLRPADPYRERPRIYIGGESEPARALAAEMGDVWFINGQPLEDVIGLINDLAGRPRVGAPLRFGLSAFVIARATEEEAQAHLMHLFALASKDMQIRMTQHTNTDPKSVMAATMRRDRKSVV